MTSQRNDPPRYGEWLAYIFGRTTEESDPFQMDWIFRAAAGDIADLVQHTFENSGRDLTEYSDRQVSIGLQALLFCNFADFAHTVAGADVSEAQKIAVLRSMEPLYRDCLAVRSPAVLGHRSETDGNPLEFLTYMLWDVSPFDVMAASTAGMSDALVQTLDATLRLPNPACVESALHGLGHLPKAFRQRGTAVIDGWLAEKPDLRPELLNYARAARTGCIQ